MNLNRLTWRSMLLILTLKLKKHSRNTVHFTDSPAKGNYHAVIVAVNHDEYKNLEESGFSELLENGEGVFVDVKGIYEIEFLN